MSPQTRDRAEQSRAGQSKERRHSRSRQRVVRDKDKFLSRAEQKATSLSIQAACSPRKRKVFFPHKNVLLILLTCVSNCQSAKFWAHLLFPAQQFELQPVHIVGTAYGVSLDHRPQQRIVGAKDGTGIPPE